MSHHKLSHEGNHADQLHQKEREDKYEYAINGTKPHHRESRGIESKEIRTKIDNERMYQVDSEAIIREIDNKATPLWGKVLKSIFEEYKHCYPLKD